MYANYVLFDKRTLEEKNHAKKSVIFLRSKIRRFFFLRLLKLDQYTGNLRPSHCSLHSESALLQCVVSHKILVVLLRAVFHAFMHYWMILFLCVCVRQRLPLIQNGCKAVVNRSKSNAIILFSRYFTTKLKSDSIHPSIHDG